MRFVVGSADENQARRLNRPEPFENEDESAQEQAERDDRDAELGAA